jgi:hypothetical protein
VYQKLVYSLCVALVLGLVCPSWAQIDPSLVGWWRLDEGAGTTAADSSGNGNNGDIVGDPAWVVGQIGKALQFDGDDDYVEVPHTEGLNVDNEVTVALWVNAERYVSGAEGWGGIMAKGNSPRSYSVYTTSAGNIHFSTAGVGTVSAAIFPLNEWAHVTCIVVGGGHEYYINGEAAGTGGSGIVLPGNTNTANVTLGNIGGEANRIFQGMLDDARVYNRALAVEELAAVMKGELPVVAADPAPEDLATDVIRDGDLNWRAGDFAQTHNVYLSTVWEDVDSASAAALVSEGQTETAYDPGRLDFGQTYFWRVDEVNGAPDFSVFAGDVWTFAVEPFAYPITGITATASSSHQNSMGPENTVNGSGLNDLGQHATEATTMWLSGMGDGAPSIQYEFDKVYKLHEMQVWNSNQIIESFVGLGAKDVVVEHSLDGAAWTVLDGASQFAQASGAATYEANTIVDFAGTMARFVRITINAGWGMMPQYGLSELSFLYVPTAAREPMPADASMVDGVDVLLQWRAGREAASHQVYLGTDAQDLPLLATTEENQEPAGELSYSTTYYWSVTEVNDSEDPTSHASNIWSFTTPDFGIVDSFDQYDDLCNRIFFAWEDGLGHNGGAEIDNCEVPESNGNGGGSIVGNDQAPFAEKTIVNAGSTQSMPFNYDNSFGPSEASVSLSGQDWTANGVQTLALSFRGATDNTGQLYVKINNNKIVYDGEVNKALWMQWPIDLSGVGGLQNVNSLTVGVDGASAAGMLYIDDIRLYPLPSESLVPPPPLAGFWNLDEGTGTVVADSSGNGNDGVFVGEPVWVAGQVGTALQFNGVDNYVEVPHDETLTVYNEAAVALWMNPERYNSEGEGWGGVMGKGAPRAYSLFTTDAGILHFSTGGVGSTSNDAVPLNEWSHVVAMVSAGSHAYYINGQASGGGGSGIVLPGESNSAPVTFGNINETARFYQGMLDDVRVYNRALSEEEVTWLASGTALVEMP